MRGSFFAQGSFFAHHCLLYPYLLPELVFEGAFFKLKLKMEKRIEGAK